MPEYGTAGVYVTGGADWGGRLVIERSDVRYIFPLFATMPGACSTRRFRLLAVKWMALPALSLSPSVQPLLLKPRRCPENEPRPETSPPPHAPVLPRVPSGDESVIAVSECERASFVRNALTHVAQTQTSPYRSPVPGSLQRCEVACANSTTAFVVPCFVKSSGSRYSTKSLAFCFTVLRDEGVTVSTR